MTAEARPAEFEGRLAAGKDWREIVAWVGDLPPMPHVASRAISMVEDPDTTANELEKLLSSDAALAARVLKIANSAMFSRQREITTLTQAIMIIGFKALKGIIVAATLRQLNKRSGPNETMIWQNSVVTAMASNLLCQKLKKRYVDEMFLLGLLHSLGQIVLLTQMSADYKKVFSLIKEKGLDYSSAEQQILGFAHSLIGALVAKKWNFSADTCQIILHYRDVIDGDKPESELEEKTAIIQLADMVAHASGVGHPEGYPEESERMLKLAIYSGFDPKTAADELKKLAEDCKARFEKEGSVYG